MPRTCGLKCTGHQTGTPLQRQRGCNVAAVAQFARNQLERLTRVVTIVTSGPATITVDVALPVGQGGTAKEVEIHLPRPECLRHLLTEACESLVD